MDRTKETREEFEERYSKQSPGVVFGENMISLPCDCEDGGGPTHWAAVRNNSDAIEVHNELYALKGVEDGRMD